MDSDRQASRQRLIVLELNELCPVLVDRFMEEGILPNFKRLRERSQAFVTDTNEAVLEPWTQWVTVHTGVPLAEHGIAHLDEANKLKHDAFWDSVHDGNLLLISPMNVRFVRQDASIFMPDPWAASQQPSSDIAPLYNFVRAAVSGHARTDGLPRKEALAALAYLVGRGLSMGSLIAAGHQLLQELASGEDAKWRRAVVLDRLLWDVFAYYWKSSRAPKVGVFFSNATAHFQHKYWRHHDPAAFELKPAAAELAVYKNAIRFGYQAHDRLIGKALKLLDGNTSLALCTALSQQPMRDYEERGGKSMFVAKNFLKLLTILGVGTVRVEHVMAEESKLHFPSRLIAEEALVKLASARTDKGRAVFKTRGFDGESIIVGCDLFGSEVDENTLIAANDATLCFYDHFKQLPTTTSAKHHPDGIFWLATPSTHGSVTTSRLPLTQVRSKFEQALGMAPGRATS